MGNPHAVVHVASVEALGALDPERKDLNVEYVEDVGARPTCACACTSAAWGRPAPAGPAPALPSSPRCCGAGEPRGTAYAVDVPGGRLVVTWQEDGHVLLAGARGAGGGGGVAG